VTDDEDRFLSALLLSECSITSTEISAPKL